MALNTDEYIRRRKGSQRPLQALEQRFTAMKLAAETVSCDVEIIVLWQDDPSELLARYKPDVYLLGSDYQDQPIAGAEHCGQVVFVERLPGFSTTELLARRESHDAASTVLA